MENNSGTRPGEAGNGGGDTSPMDQVKQQTQQAVRKTQEMAGQVVDQARDQVRSQLSSQKERAAEGLGGVAEALRLTSEQLRERDQATFGDYAASAAEMVERFSGHLKERDINQMIWEIESFGRRQPALFMGGAFALGFLASRFLKSSSERYDGYYTGRAGGNGYGATTGHALPTAYDRGNERATSEG